MSNSPSRSFDITLMGATGFVGALTAGYLAANAPADVRIALAGRNQTKPVSYTHLTLPTILRV